MRANIVFTCEINDDIEIKDFRINYIEALSCDNRRYKVRWNTSDFDVEVIDKNKVMIEVYLKDFDSDYAIEYSENISYAEFSARFIGESKLVDLQYECESQNGINKPDEMNLVLDKIKIYDFAANTWYLEK